MNKKIQFLGTLAAVLVLLLSLLPVWAAGDTEGQHQPDQPGLFTEEEEQFLYRDVFQKIESVLDLAAVKMGGQAVMKVQDYCALVPEVRKVVEHSSSYREGTLRENGSFLTWETQSGFACCYDPRMEAALRQSPRENSAEPCSKSAGILRETALQLSEDASLPMSGSPSSMRIGLIQPFCADPDTCLETNFGIYGPGYTRMGERLSEITGGRFIHLMTADATIDNVAKVIESCGLVIVESHGVTDYYDGLTGDETTLANCSYLVLRCNRGLSTEDMVPDTGPYGTFYHALIGCGYAEVSGYCIAGRMEKDAPHSLLYMGICSGMATDGMYAPLRARGVETVWGYSQPVYFTGESLYMNKILDGVCEGKTFSDAVAEAKEMYGDWDPAYQGYTEEQCVAEQVAFPITVSSEDPYPGRDKINTVQKVCSGWKLLGDRFKVEAVPENAAHGAVSVKGTRILAAPVPGYKTSGYRVLSGEASASQDGDLFAVTPSSDCTIEVLFTEKQTVRVSCMAYGGIVAELNCLEGESVCLPEQAIEIPEWHFLGWTEKTVPLCSVKPEIYEPGTEIAAEQDRVFYALYGKDLPGEETVYHLVTEDPGNWEGNYVVTSGRQAGGSYVMAGIEGTGQDYYNYWNCGSQYLEESGILTDGDCLRNVDDYFVFTLSDIGSGYTIRSKRFGNYLSNQSGALLTIDYIEPTICYWEPRISYGHLIIHSPVNTRYNNLACFPLYGFCLYDSTGDTLMLWKEELGPKHLYASEPAAHTHTPGEPAEENRVEPDESHDGGYDLTVRCTECGVILESTHVVIPMTGPECPFTDITEGKYYYDAVLWAYRRSPRIASGTGEDRFSPNDTCTRAQVVTFLWRAAGCPEPSAEETPFTDIRADKYYYKAVLWALEQEITSGTSPDRFSPNDGCTRAQAVTFLWRFAGQPEVPSVNPFKDVKSGRFYYKPVLWASEKNITTGTGAGIFSPDSTCTRGQIVTFLYRYMGQ